jgi:predicted RNA-binding protein with PUA-like domain
MNIWLMKSEPDEFSIDDLQKRKTEPWTGVRNYQARNFMRAAQKGDLVLFYHSNCEEPGIVGLARVSKTAFTDPTQFIPDSDYFDAKSKKENPRWSCVEVAFLKKFKNTLSLDQLRESKKLKSLLILRPGNRLSITPVRPDEFKEIERLSN